VTWNCAALEHEILCWRLVKKTLSHQAFTGEGARKFPGRWNQRGQAMVYTAATQSLALLEMLTQATVLPVYAAIAAVIPAGTMMSVIDVESLPENWREYPAPGSLGDLGGSWLQSAISPVLRVPSAVLPTEFNYLLNPAHPDFTSIRIGSSRDLLLDERLFAKKEPGSPVQ